MAVRLEVVADGDALAAAAAVEFLHLGADALRRQGVFRVALAGGTTPRAAYERIASSWREAPGGALDWSRIHLFWGDERMVPADDPESNFGMAHWALISRVPIPEENVHRIAGDLPDAEAAAARYEEELRGAFAGAPVAVPRFDLVLLGMGADGHTASLFPGSPALDESSKLAVSARHPETGAPRVTLTFPVLNRAAAIVVVVSGAAKAAALERALRTGGAPPSSGRPTLPAARLRPTAGTLLWLADEAAAPWTRSESTGPNT
jgi:6-phosphogluconolactonase